MLELSKQMKQRGREEREAETKYEHIQEYEEEMLMDMGRHQESMKPSLSLMQQQPEINFKIRPLLLDFLMDVTNKLRLSEATFPMTVNLIDRYCSRRIVKKQHFQLLGLTSLWVSSKHLDSKCKVPMLADLCRMCCNCYNKQLFLEMENHLLKSLEWKLMFPTYDNFVELYLNNLYCKGLIMDEGIIMRRRLDIKAMASYIGELVQFYPNLYFNYNSSQMALGSLVTSLLICGVPFRMLACMSSINSSMHPEARLLPTAFSSFYKALVKVLVWPPPSLKQKYFYGQGLYPSLMNLMVGYVNCRLMEPSVTPGSEVTSHKRSLLSLSSSSPGQGFNTPNQYIPRTPVSNNISPVVSCHKGKVPSHSGGRESFLTLEHHLPLDYHLPSPCSPSDYLHPSPAATGVSDIDACTGAVSVPVFLPSSAVFHSKKRSKQDPCQTVCYR